MSDSDALRGLTAVVTGGTRGLGASIGALVAARGARTIVVGRDPDRTAERAAGLGAEPLVADLAAPDAADRLLEMLDDRAGGFDVLVNNAGISGNGASHRMTDERVDEILAVNLRTPLLLAARGAARMAQRGGGAILNVSSALATRGAPGTSIYAAAKAGLVGATRALASEWGPHGVRLNAIEPAITRSDMTSAELADDAIPAYLAQVPLRRLGEPDDIAALAAFLVSPAAAYITGQVVGVDGGWSTTSPPLFGGEVAD
jgi:NAD(P)-dependent dehydrogenase (short-subunit alcohol dehydrogenase family)